MDGLTREGQKAVKKGYKILIIRQGENGTISYEGDSNSYGGLEDNPEALESLAKIMHLQINKEKYFDIFKSKLRKNNI